MARSKLKASSSKKNPGGRPSKYKSEYEQLAYNYALLGADDIKMAEFFGVCERTLNYWKKKHPKFLQALKRGKDIADAEVCKSLFKRATGYSHPEDKIFNNNGEALIVPTTKHYPPDSTAMIFWLSNRQRALWRNKQDHELTGKDGGPIEITEMTREELLRIAARGIDDKD